MGKITAVSPLAPKQFPVLPVIDGVRFATIAAGVRYQGRTDVMLAELAPGTTIAGTFTKSATRAAPVLDCQAKIGGTSDAGAAILVNSGNANAFTGKGGVVAVEAITEAVAKVCNIPQSRVFTSSTGVIGEPLPHDKIIAKLQDLHDTQGSNRLGDAAQAIMTTDTFAKGSTKTVMINGAPVKIAGIAKGSGMIAPDMATMLVYIFTDAKISQPDLQTLVSRNNAVTFNCITVDSDTSTSDSLMVAATGASGVDVTGNESFETALHDLMRDLAHQVVRDGEGATKFVTINVTGAASDADARLVAMATANSPLVKTAIAGEDPNWGRIVMAVGKSGAAADRDLLS
ncbi:MAG: bifunctional glutamate N-acetyltransferase/amino-acid acetyltransferase ArgJ, partial [Sulfitobacter sp.]|nr:bifunctional glutamate N-acetyltransferase/amino-acid acetyltransferase ArgJ [Sulfitobacter sp.]